MKHLIYFMLPLILLSALCACSNDEQTVKPVIQGETKEVSVGYQADTTHLAVTATQGYDITIEDAYADWLSAKMLPDQSLEIVCTENTDTQARSGRVILRRADVMWIFTVNQEGAPGEEKDTDIEFQELQVMFGMHFYIVTAQEAKKIKVGCKLVIETTDTEGNVAITDAANKTITSLDLSGGVASMKWTEKAAAMAAEGMRIRLNSGTNNIVRMYTTAPDPEYFIDVPEGTEMYGMVIYQFPAATFRSIPVGTVIGFYFSNANGTPVLTDSNNNTLYTYQLWDNTFWVTWTQEMADATADGARLRISATDNPLVKIQYWP